MKDKADEVKTPRLKPKVQLREIDVKDIKKFSGLGFNSRVKLTAYGTIADLGKDMWSEKQTLSCTIEFDDIDIEKAGKQDEAIEKMKKAETVEELEKAKKEADDGEKDEADEE